MHIHRHTSSKQTRACGCPILCFPRDFPSRKNATRAPDRLSQEQPRRRPLTHATHIHNTHEGNNRTTRREEAVIRRAERIAHLFDQRFRIPGTSFRFGYDAIIGLLPIAGDTLGAIVSLYLILEALRLRLGVRPIARMLFNVLVDWLVGLLPVADIFLDAAYKANTRNARVLAEAIERKRRRREQALTAP